MNVTPDKTSRIRHLLYAIAYSVGVEAGDLLPDVRSAVDPLDLLDLTDEEYAPLIASRMRCGLPVNEFMRLNTLQAERLVAYG